MVRPEPPEPPSAIGPEPLAVSRSLRSPGAVPGLLASEPSTPLEPATLPRTRVARNGGRQS